MFPFERSSQHGQVMVLFALALTAIVLGVAVVVDGGYAFAQRRSAQNAADFAAMAGTRIVGVSLVGQPVGAGTAQNVENAITSVLAANDAQLVSAQYVSASGGALGNVVGASSIPNGANGVVVGARTNWKPFLLGVIGLTDWAASATATAITPGSSFGGGVLPVGMEDDTYDGLSECPLTSIDDCISNLTSGQLNIPGGFGWLSFGLHGLGGKCDWESSLGMVDGGCESNQPFLDSQIGPPPDSQECCSEAGTGEGEDKVASLTGNEWGDLSYYVDNQIPVWLPIWDYAGGNGVDAWYHIVGFGPVIFTGVGDPHAKWLEGAGVDVTCGTSEDPDRYLVEGHDYCSAPLGAFKIDVTGAVRLIN
jgi:hypothetical protein